MEELTLNQILIQLNTYKDENAVLKKQILKDAEKVKRANEILETFEKIDLLGSREARNLLIEKEINEIKSEELFNSKDYNKYGKNVNYIFNEEDFSIFNGTKKLATIYDQRFFYFLEKVLKVAYYIFDYYKKSVIFLNAKDILDRQKKEL
jgi:hypothetical protein